MASIIFKLNKSKITRPLITYIPKYFCSNEVNAIKIPKLTSLKRGPGGRSSFSGIIATVFGSSGFLGRYVCNELGKIGTQLILPYRCPLDEIKHLRLCGDLGQIIFTQFDLLDDESIKKAIKHSNVVINLIGRDYETLNFNFDCVHFEGAKKIAKLTKEAGIETFIHMSALNADKKPEPFLTKNGSQFLASKARGEEIVRKVFPEAIIFRPSDIWGEEDRFVKYFTSFWRHQVKIMPIYKSGEKTEKQPVYVGDVAKGIVATINNKSARGKTFQAVGPRRYLLSELVDWFHRIMDKTFQGHGYFRYDIELDPIFKLRVTMSQLVMYVLPREVLQHIHWDRLERECYSDKVEENMETLEDLGVCLTPMEELIPWSLRNKKRCNYYEYEIHEIMQPKPPKSISSKNTCSTC